MYVCVVTFIIFVYTSVYSIEMASEDADGALVAGPVTSLTTLDAHRAAMAAKLQGLRTERAELLIEIFSLGKKKGDLTKKEAIQARTAGWHQYYGNCVF